MGRSVWTFWTGAAVASGGDRHLALGAGGDRDNGDQHLESRVPSNGHRHDKDNASHSRFGHGVKVLHAIPLFSGQNRIGQVGWCHAASPCRAFAISGHKNDALSAPLVWASALSANSGGQSVEFLNCDNRPLETPIRTLNSVSDGDAGCAR